MSSIDSLAAAFEGLRQGFESGRLAHAYLVVGSPTGNARALAESFLQLLFCRDANKPCGACAECRKVKEHAHPDILWLAPESKGRKIDIEQIREDLNPRIAQTSYGGGWKVGVLLHADRMTDQAANAFLKTLEEPPAKSLLLLLTDAPQHLLPTIVSRCQRLLLSEVTRPGDGPWRGDLLEILRRGPPSDAGENLLQSAKLRGILKAMEESITAEEEAKADPDEDKEVRKARIAARVNEVRFGMMRCLLLWRRDVLATLLQADPSVLHYAEEGEAIRRQASQLTFASALRQVQAVEEMVRRLEKFMPDEAVFETGLR